MAKRSAWCYLGIFIYFFRFLCECINNMLSLAFVQFRYFPSHICAGKMRESKHERKHENLPAVPLLLIVRPWLCSSCQVKLTKSSFDLLSLYWTNLAAHALLGDSRLQTIPCWRNAVSDQGCTKSCLFQDVFDSKSPRNEQPWNGKYLFIQVIIHPGENSNLTVGAK